jgi:hypothetical protein
MVPACLDNSSFDRLLFLSGELFKIFHSLIIIKLRLYTGIFFTNAITAPSDSTWSCNAAFIDGSTVDLSLLLSVEFL